jgi:hypothetical protein
MSIKCGKCQENFVAIHHNDTLFKFHCSSCGGQIQAKEKLRGSTAPCPHCEKVVPVGDYTQRTKQLQETEDAPEAPKSYAPTRPRGGSITSKIKRTITRMFGG